MSLGHYHISTCKDTAWSMIAFDAAKIVCKANRHNQLSSKVNDSSAICLFQSHRPLSGAIFMDSIFCIILLQSSAIQKFRRSWEVLAPGCCLAVSYSGMKHVLFDHLVYPLDDCAIVNSVLNTWCPTLSFRYGSMACKKQWLKQVHIYAAPFKDQKTCLCMYAYR